MKQESLIGNRVICHSGLNFYWSPREKKEIQVIIAMRMDPRHKIVLNNRNHLVHHLYFMLSDICGLNLQLKDPREKTQVVKVYDN